MDMMKKVPVREQDPLVRATNFKEVCLGYNKEEAEAEAQRCLNCKNPKCVQGCPVNIDIPGFITKVKEGDVKGAYDVIGLSSSLPAICGRVCPQETQCEGRCVRGIKGEPVSIGKLERYVADTARQMGVKPQSAEKKNGHKVAVIGSGPAGLTCAGDLAKIVGKSAAIDDLMKNEGFEAVFIGTGAGLPKFMGIPGEQAMGVFSANEYLTRSNLMKAFSDDSRTPIMKAKKAVIVGGGNVAMDAARTALRLGADTYIVYRRSEEELPARREEVLHAKEEGIHFNLLTNPVEIHADENGWVKGITCLRMELGEPDASGRRRPVEIPGSEFYIECDAVIMSLGTSPNPLISSTTEGLDADRRGCIVADEEKGQTSKDGVFAGGDAVTGAATVILAMGAGKAGAKGIDEYIQGK